MNLRSILLALALASAFVAAFLAGRGTVVRELEAQGTGTNRPDLPPIGPTTLPGQQPDDIMVYPEDSGGAVASANGFLAVTGSYGVGTSVLYVIDTESKQLAVYEARGGARTMRRLTLVGARRIDLDLQLRGYNDESEYPYAALEKMFASRNRSAAADDRGGATESSAQRR